MSCKAEGGTPAPNVILMIDGQTVPSQIQSVQCTLNTINRSYDNKTVTCQASNPTYSQNTMTVSAVIYLNCKNLIFPHLLKGQAFIIVTTAFVATCTVPL